MTVMDTPRTVELARRLEPVTRDTFLSVGDEVGDSTHDDPAAQRPPVRPEAPARLTRRRRSTKGDPR